MAATASSASEALCIRCGFCCDGTLFGHVPIEASEARALPAPLVARERPTEDRGTRVKLAVVQPCAAFHAHCTVYDSRPHACRSFRCTLLRAVELGHVTANEAAWVIDRVQQGRELIERKLAMPFDSAKRELAANAARDAEAFLALLAVEAELDANFRPRGGE